MIPSEISTYYKRYVDDTNNATPQDYHNPFSQMGSQFDVIHETDTDDADEEDPIAASLRLAILDDSPSDDRSRGAESPTAIIDMGQLDIGEQVAQDQTMQDKSQSVANSLENTENISFNPEPPSFDHQRPSILVRDDQGCFIVPAADDAHSVIPKDDSTTPKDLVVQMSHYVAVMNATWMRRLGPGSVLYEQCSVYSPSFLIELGLGSLELCYRQQNLPIKFAELFSLLHIAFAFSHIVHKDSDSYHWDGFSQDIYQWRLALQDSAEVDLFVEVWRKLWCPHLSSNLCSIPDGLARSALQQSSAIREYESDISGRARGHGMSVRADSRHPSDQISLCRLLTGGLVIEGCSRYLDGKQCSILLPAFYLDMLMEW